MIKLLIFFTFFLITATIHSETIVQKELPKQLEQSKEIHHQKKISYPKYLEQNKEKKTTLSNKLGKKVFFKEDVSVGKTTFLKGGARMEGTTIQPLSESTSKLSYYRMQEKKQREKKAKLQKEKSERLAVWIRPILRFFRFSKSEKK